MAAQWPRRKSIRWLYDDIEAAPKLEADKGLAYMAAGDATILFRMLEDSGANQDSAKEAC